MASEIDVAAGSGLILNSRSNSLSPEKSSNSLNSGGMKPRALGKIRIQGQRSLPDKRSSASSTKKEDFNVQGESFVPVENPLTERKYSLQQTQGITPKPNMPNTITVSEAQKAIKKEVELNKKLEEALRREKSLKQELEKLQQESQARESQLTKRIGNTKELHEELKKVIEETNLYKKLYEEEKQEHNKTRIKKEEAEREIEKLREVMREEIRSLQCELEDVREVYEEKIKTLVKSNEEAIADRDKRIENLKRQIAGTLGSKSHERQSQIDDLSKELQRVTDELESMRRKNKAGTSACQQCVQYKVSLNDKEEKIKSVLEVCAKFKGRLGEQEELMKLLAKASGTGQSKH